MDSPLLPGIIYFVLAIVAILSAYRAGDAGGGKQRLGMGAAGIGFILLGIGRMLSVKDASNRMMLVTAESRFAVRSGEMSILFAG